MRRPKRFFSPHGEIGHFTARLIPVVRQYLSLPAGIVRMNIARFSLYTGLGAGLWVSVLAWIGYIAGQSEALWASVPENRNGRGGAVLRGCRGGLRLGAPRARHPPGLMRARTGSRTSMTPQNSKSALARTCFAFRLGLEEWRRHWNGCHVSDSASRSGRRRLFTKSLDLPCRTALTM